MRARTSSGSAASDDAVKPTKSQKRTETSLRSSSGGVGAASASAAPQNGQNGNSPGSSLPQAAHWLIPASLGRTSTSAQMQETSRGGTVPRYRPRVGAQSSS